MKSIGFQTIVVYFAIACFTLSVTLPAIFGQQESSSQFDLEYAGDALWGRVMAVATKDNYAYFACAGGLLVYDIGDPLSPQFVSQLYLPGGPTADLTIEGNFLYLTESGDPGSPAYNVRMHIVDISNPFAPKLMPQSLYGGSGGSVSVSRGYAYIGSCNGLQVADISNPENPVWLCSVLDGNCAGIDTIVGDLGFGGSRGDLVIFDLSTPELPVVVTTFDTPGSVRKVSVVDSLAFVADGDMWWPAMMSTLTVVNIARLDSPLVLDTLGIHGGTRALHVSGNTACIAGEWGVYAVDVSIPDNLNQIGFSRTPSMVASFARSRDYLIAPTVLSETTDGSLGPCSTCFCPGMFAPDGSNVIDRGDIEIIDISDPANPCAAATIPGPGLVTKLNLHGDYAFVQGKDRSLQIIDVSQPDMVTWVGTLNTPHSISVFTTSGDRLAVGGYDPSTGGVSGLSLYDLTDPLHPQLLYSRDIDFNIYDLKLRDGFLFVAAGVYGILVFDVSSPDCMILSCQYDTPYATQSLLLDGQYLYASDGGLLVLDITDPAHPSFVGRYDDGQTNGRPMLKRGNLLYWRVYNGLVIMDVSDPAAPILLSETVIGSYLSDITLSEKHPNVLLASNAWDGLFYVDISNPANPQVFGQYNTSGAAEDLDAGGDYVFVADNWNFLRLRLPEVTAIEEPSEPAFELPAAFSLHQNYPNPFNPSTTIVYELPEASDLTLEIHNVLGQKVRTLVSGRQPAGTANTQWNGTDDRGLPVSSGVYFVRLHSDRFSDSKKMLLLK